MDHTLPTNEEVKEALATEDDNIVASLQTEEERKVALKLLPLIAAKANELAEAKKAKELKAEVAKLVEENKKYITDEIEKIRKANTPLSTEELAKMLSQEYVTFDFKMQGRNGTGMKNYDFVIRELPVKIERKVLTTVQKTLAARMKEIAAFDWSAGATTFEKINSLVSMVPGMLETLAECCAICLDPYDENDITAEWVLSNMNVYRMMAVLQAQANASRWRDFLSLVWQAIPQQMIA